MRWNDYPKCSWTCQLWLDGPVVHLEGMDFGIASQKRANARIMKPKCIRRGADAGLKLIWIREVEVSDSGGKHQDIARALRRAKEEFFHFPRTHKEKCPYLRPDRPDVKD